MINCNWLKLNVDIKWNKHDDIRKESERAKHLWKNLNQKLQAFKNYRK